MCLTTRVILGDIHKPFGVYAIRHRIQDSRIKIKSIVISATITAAVAGNEILESHAVCVRARMRGCLRADLTSLSPTMACFLALLHPPMADPSLEPVAAEAEECDPGIIRDS